MGFGKSVKQSSFVLVIVAASFSTLFVTGLTHAQSGIELEVEGNSTVDGDMLVEGNLDVLGLITAGTGSGNVLTNASGLIDGSKIQTGTVNSDQLNDGAVTGAKIAGTTIAEGNLQDGAVTSGKLAADAVTNAKIADSAVGTAEIAADAVGASEIAAGAVGSLEISDGTVATADLAANAVDTSKIVDGTITNSDIAATNSITADRLAADSVGSSEIAADAVGSSEIATGTVGTLEIADGSVGAADLAANAVDTSKILDGTITNSDIAATNSITADRLAADSVGSSEIAAAAVGASEIATGAVGTSEIADGTVGTADLAANAVNADKLDETASYTVDNLYATGKIGIGTTTVPRGGLGGALLALHGPDMNLAGPHFRTTTSADDYPLMDFMSWKHDNMGIRFDAYWDGAQKSADAGSNAMLVKGGDKLSMWYSSGVAAGSTLTWNYGIILDLTNGSVSMPNLPTGQGSYPVRIDANGKLYKDTSSSIRYKENVREAATADTSWIYGLRAVMFDYKDHTLGMNQCGLIAEEVEQVNANIVVYREDITYGPEVTDENGNPDPSGYRPMIVTKTNEPETVRYDKLTVPMLAEMQKLRDRVKELDAYFGRGHFVNSADRGQ